MNDDDYDRLVMDLHEALAHTEGEVMLSTEEAELLHELARQVDEGCIVEVGSYRGRSTVALATGASVPVYAIDPHEQFTGVLGAQFGPADRVAFYRTMLRANTADRVRLVNLPSEVACAGWIDRIGLLFIDGDHRYEGVRRDFECWQPHLTSEATVALDDSIDPELGPRRVVAEASGSGFTVDRVVGKITVLRRA
ncbi:MAG TPA: class I SAM-dependent methyltransferase [Solirubrobacterales bacterium]|nr:class I SAM-dependent methyltransferase [Solirubrobacterales bacterium]